jgi:hypothetical protein
VAVIGLVAATFLADGAAFVAIARMTAAHGRLLALALLVVAWAFSIATCLALRAAGGGGGGGGGRREPPEPPWWPEFERAFRDYARTHPGRRRSRLPKQPVGRP